MIPRLRVFILFCRVPRTRTFLLTADFTFYIHLHLVCISAGNLFKIIFRVSAERVQALPIIPPIYLQKSFSLAGSPDIYSMEVVED